jgi:hypothetical protein
MPVTDVTIPIASATAMRLLARTDSGGWEPGIGDPTFFGWLAVICYFAAAGLCGWAFRKENDALRRGAAPADAIRPYFWLALAIVMVLLGFNKQLDLQSWFTQVGRDMAKDEGWYESRRGVQFLFVVMIFLGGVAALAAAWWYVRGAWMRYRMAFFGLIYLAAFIVIRAASFHHVDVLLKFGLGDFRINHLMELSGIGFVGYSAWLAASGKMPLARKLVPFERTVRIR